ncbi:hypothetical protein E4V37_09895 [Proteus mirabilis]|nr:hypothetical protein E4V37_09895 [Proteus mirabilis]
MPFFIGYRLVLSYVLFSILYSLFSILYSLFSILYSLYSLSLLYILFILFISDCCKTLGLPYVIFIYLA